MRVLSITSFFPGANPARGIFVKSEIECLEKLGVHVDLVAKTSMNPLGYVNFAVLSVFKLILGNYDLIHAYYVPHSALIPAIFKRKPLVVTLLGTDANVFPWRSKIHFLVSRFMLERADKIIAVSIDIKKTITSRMNVDERKIEVLHCSGVDTELFRPIPRELALKTTGLTAQRVVIFIGGFRAAKGIEDVLTVARRFPNVLFVLIGGDRLKMPPGNCLVLREMHHEDLPSWICSADLMILPSRGEGVPSVILESLACGTPVIASDVGGCSEAVIDGSTGFLIPVGDLDALTSKIAYLLDTEKIRVEMGRKGRADMLARYEHVKLVERLVRTYESLIHSEPPHR